MNTHQKLTVREMALIALFAAVMSVCAWISLPMAVPFTMQTFAVFLAAALLGARGGVLSVAVYILMGAVGLPVFAGFKGGLGAVLGATGGYIVGFLFTALTVGLASDKWGKRFWPLFLSMAGGLALCYAFGTAWFVAVYAKQSGPVGIVTALGWCVFPYILPDMIKAALACAVAARIRRRVPG